MLKEEDRPQNAKGYIYPNLTLEPGRETKCRHCGVVIGLLMSQRTNRWYPVNAYEIDGEFRTNKRDFHNCLKTS